MIWVLIFVISGTREYTSFTVEFNSREECIKGAKIIDEKVVNPLTSKKALCLEKGKVSK